MLGVSPYFLKCLGDKGSITIEAPPQTDETLSVRKYEILSNVYGLRLRCPFRFSVTSFVFLFLRYLNRYRYGLRYPNRYPNKPAKT